MMPDQVDRPTPEVEEGGIPNTEGQATLSDTEGLRRSQRTRRPPGYLGEYYPVITGSSRKATSSR